MSGQDRTYRIFISAAEPSGDGHCAALIEAIRQANPDIEFVGVGGDKMAAAGCELFEKTADKAAMIYKAFGHVARYIKLIFRIKAYLKKNKVDLVIVCDSPAFNFHVAKAAKKAGIRTLFYVAPQLWAWAGWRIGKLRKCCDKLACILPFEQDWFTHRGVDTTFVGNPVLDEFKGKLSKNARTYKDLEPKKATIALMPGSRQAEIDGLWPAMQQIAVQLRRRYPGINLTAVAVDEKGKHVLKSMQVLGFRCRYIIGSVVEAASEADLSIVASGTATLQVAACGCPMVIVYQSSKLLWHLLGRWLVKTKRLSLVNILAGDELVPEYMPYFTSIDPIVYTLERLLKDCDRLSQISSGLIELVKPLQTKTAARKTADIAVSMLPPA